MSEDSDRGQPPSPSPLLSTGEADLEGRTARCAYGCGITAPSARGLAFFEYLGEGSQGALISCGAIATVRWGKPCDPSPCHMHEIAHGAINRGTGRPGITDHPFTPRGGQEQDRFYCGCRGWD